MKKESSEKPSHLFSITAKEFEKLKNSPAMLAIDAEEERIKNGTATEEERMEHESSLKRVREAPKDRLTSYHI